MEVVNLAHKFALFADHWCPRIVGELIHILPGRPMKIVTILGSPRQRGNTAAVLQAFETLVAPQHQVERINITDYRVVNVAFIADLRESPWRSHPCRVIVVVCAPQGADVDLPHLQHRLHDVL